MSKWIEFVELPVNGKTKAFAVIPKEFPAPRIGTIKWYGAWRCYAFFPEPNCVFEKTCLKDIIAFIEALMSERKKNKTENKNI